MLKKTTTKVRLLQPNANFFKFTQGPQTFFKFIGIDYAPEQTKLARFIKWMTVVNLMIALFFEIAYVLKSETVNPELPTAIVYIGYFFVVLCKMIAVIYYRSTLASNYANLRYVYPTRKEEQLYRLQGYLHTYRFVERFLMYFFQIIVGFYLLLTLVASFIEQHETGTYGYKMMLYFWHPVPLNESLVAYFVFFVFESICSYTVGFILFSCDCCLYSSLAQLCLHFDWIKQRILELQPGNAGSIHELKDIIRQHQSVLELAREINRAFAPPIIFSLMSSSLILCFTLYQMLDDVPLILVFKMIMLICYEMKQVVITCYFGNLLLKTSSDVFDALYMHDWLNGTIEYRKLVLFMMMRTLRPASMRIGGLSDISLVTLKQVLSMSYQLFAVLKSA